MKCHFSMAMVHNSTLGHYTILHNEQNTQLCEECETMSEKSIKHRRINTKKYVYTGP